MRGTCHFSTHVYQVCGLQEKNVYVLALMAWWMSLAAPASGDDTWSDVDGKPVGERILNYDLTQLMRLPPEEALRELDKFRGVATSAAPDRPIYLPLLDAATWAARNPALPAYFEAKIKEHPITLETRLRRSDLFHALAWLPAEWAVRILASAAQVQGEVVTSSQYDLTDGDLVRAMFLENDAPFDPRKETNANLAAMRLAEMKIPGLEWHKDYGAYPATKESEFAELVKAKWGDKAVLNADLGLGPDNRPLAQNGKRPDTRRGKPPPSAAHHAAGSDGGDGTQSLVVRNSAIVVALVLLLLASGWWLVKTMRRRGKGVKQGKAA